MFGNLMAVAIADAANATITNVMVTVPEFSVPETALHWTLKKCGNILHKNTYRFEYKIIKLVSAANFSLNFRDHMEGDFIAFLLTVILAHFN